MNEEQTKTIIKLLGEIRTGLYCVYLVLVAVATWLGIALSQNHYQ